MWNLKYDTTKPICETEADSHGHGEQTFLLRQRGIGEGLEWEVGVSRYKLLNMWNG